MTAPTPSGGAAALSADDELQFAIDDLVNDFYYATVAFVHACDTFGPFSPEMDAATSRVNTARATIEFEMLRDRAALLAARRGEPALRDVLKHTQDERLILAKLCADEPQFFNPLEVYAARQIRDLVLKRAALAATPEGP